MYVSFGLCTDQTTVLYQDSRLPLRSAAAEHSLAGRPDSYMSSFLSKCAMTQLRMVVNSREQWQTIPNHLEKVANSLEQSRMVANGHIREQLQKVINS